MNTMYEALAWFNWDYSWSFENNNISKHNGRNLGLDNPHDSFAFDSDDAVYNYELHM